MGAREKENQLGMLPCEGYASQQQAEHHRGARVQRCLDGRLGWRLLHRHRWRGLDGDGTDHADRFVRLANEIVGAVGAHRELDRVVHRAFWLTGVEETVLSHRVVWQGLAAPEEAHLVALGDRHFTWREAQVGAVHGNDDRFRSGAHAEQGQHEAHQQGSTHDDRNHVAFLKSC